MVQKRVFQTKKKIKREKNKQKEKTEIHFKWLRYILKYSTLSDI